MEVNMGAIICLVFVLGSQGIVAADALSAGDQNVTQVSSNFHGSALANIETLTAKN